MIKQFKIFEAINVGIPEIGDYVICRDEQSKELSLLLAFKIGIINAKNTNPHYQYEISFYSIPKEESYFFAYNNGKFERNFNGYEILYWSKNKKKLQQIIDANKFGL